MISIHQSKKFTLGERVEGNRPPRKCTGILKSCHSHRNTDGFKVYSYTIECEDGKERKFQHIRKLTE